jgi:hypothetical protein
MPGGSRLAVYRVLRDPIINCYLVGFYVIEQFTLFTSDDNKCQHRVEFPQMHQSRPHGIFCLGNQDYLNL